MDQLTIYAVSAIKADIHGDQAIVTFKPHGHPGVSVQMTRDALRRFVEQATRELSQSPKDAS